MRTIIFIIPVLIFCSCGSGVKKAPYSAYLIDELPGSSPAFSKDAGGNLVLSWIRERTDSVYEFCYAVSKDRGESFEAPVIVKGSDSIKPHSENLPKVIFKPYGETMAIWGIASGDKRNKYSGKIVYAQSFDDGRNWSSPKALVTDTAGYDQRYFDVALLKNGEVAIVWLDNRKLSRKEGSALYFSVTRGREGFVQEQRIAESCCQCCRTAIYVDTKEDIHVLYRGIIADSIRDMMHISTKGRWQFGSPERISEDNWVLRACPHTGPSMAENGAGLHFAWYTGAEDAGSFYSNLIEGKGKYSKRELVSFAGKHPQLAAGLNGELGLVWDEALKLGERNFSRIGIQIRSISGKLLNEYALTADTVTATYPVISSANSNEFTVAFCQKSGGKQYVYYRRLKETELEKNQPAHYISYNRLSSEGFSCSH